MADLGTTDPSARRRTRLLAAFLLVLVAVFGAVDLTGLLTIPGYAPPWYGYLFLAAAGLLNRFGRYTAAAGVALAMFPVVILGMILDGSPSRPELSLVYLAPGVLLASILLSARGTALFAAFSLATILATPAQLWIARRVDRPIWYSSGLTTGHTLTQSPHALHSFGST